MSIGGYESHIFVNEPCDKLHCPVCLGVLKDPSTCSVGHCFCFSCIQTSMIAKKACPMCAECLDIEKIGKCLPFKAIIDDLETFCPTCDSLENKNSVEHCQWTGPLHAREKHLGRECEFAYVPCIHKNCQQVVQRRHLPFHLEEECEFSVATCDLCEISFLRYYSNAHNLKCPMRLVECTNRDCRGMICQAVLQDHLDICPHSFMECPLFKHHLCHPSCTGTIKKRDKSSHVAAASTDLTVLELISRLEASQRTIKDFEAAETANVVIRSDDKKHSKKDAKSKKHGTTDSCTSLRPSDKENTLSDTWSWSDYLQRNPPPSTQQRVRATLGAVPQADKAWCSYGDCVWFFNHRTGTWKSGVVLDMILTTKGMFFSVRCSEDGIIYSDIEMDCLHPVVQVPPPPNPIPSAKTITPSRRKNSTPNASTQQQQQQQQQSKSRFKDNDTTVAMRKSRSAGNKKG